MIPRTPLMDLILVDALSNRRLEMVQDILCNKL